MPPNLGRVSKAQAWRRATGDNAKKIDVPGWAKATRLKAAGAMRTPVILSPAATLIDHS